MFGLALGYLLIRGTWEGIKGKADDEIMESRARSNHWSGYCDHNGNWIKIEYEDEKSKKG